MDGAKILDIEKEFELSNRQAYVYFSVYKMFDAIPLDDTEQAEMTPMEIVEADAYKIIRAEIKKPCRMGHLSRKTGLSKERVLNILRSIEQETGLPVEIESGNVTINKFMGSAIEPINIAKQFKRKLKIGLVSDTHFGSKYQQRTLLNEAYKIMDSEGVNFCSHSGDLVDGSPSMHAGMMHELFIQTFEEQCDYSAEFYPKAKNFKTYIRPGNHDYSWIKSDAGDPVRVVCKKRDDLVYLNPAQSAFQDKDSNILVELFHPSGGMPYSLSYRGQKLFESTVGKALSEYQVTRKLKLPHVLAIGHLHKYNHFIEGYTNVFLLPCFQSQTEYLRSKGLSPVTGFVIVTIEFDDSGNILKIKPDVYNFSSMVIEKDY